MVLALAAATFSAGAATPKEVIYSPDITLELAGLLVSDESAAHDNLNGVVTPEAIGAIPSVSELTVFHQLENGDQLLAFDTTIVLPGAVTARPFDVVRHSGSTYSIEFSGASNGVPAGARLDALSMNGAGQLLLSFDTTVSLSGITVADEDVVLFNGSSFSLFFDGSAAGLSPGVDLNALHFAPDSGFLYVSFDTGGAVGGVTFQDEDLLVHNPIGASWNLAYNGAAEHAEWVAGDLDAVFVSFSAGIYFRNGFESP